MDVKEAKEAEEVKGANKVKEANEVKEALKIEKRCYQCNKKLKMINFTCRCEHKFCIIHQNPHNHNCSYDSKANLQLKLKIENPQTIHQKLVKI